jgi:hypothetical protein
MNILFGKADVTKMSLITQKLNAQLKADGYSLLECGRRDNSGIIRSGGFVNRLEYMREEGERVILYTHEPGQKRTA